MMSRVDQNLNVRSCRACHQKGHAPIREIRVIKRRLERLVFQKDPLIRTQHGMARSQIFLKQPFPATDVRSTRIVGAVCKPQGYVAALEVLRNLYAVFHMSERLLANGGVRIPKRSIFIYLFLE